MPDERGCIRAGLFLNDLAHHQRTGRFGQRGQFLNGLFILNAYQDGPFPFILGAGVPGWKQRTPVRFLNAFHPGPLRNGMCLHDFGKNRAQFAAVRQGQKRGLNTGYLSPLNADGRHAVKVHAFEGADVHLREMRISVWVRVNTAHLAQTVGIASQPDVSESDAVLIADRHIQYLAGTRDIDRELPSDHACKFSHHLQQFPGGKTVRFNFKIVQTFQSGQFRIPDSFCVSVDHLLSFPLFKNPFQALKHLCEFILRVFMAQGQPKACCLRISVNGGDDMRGFKASGCTGAPGGGGNAVVSRGEV